jgi:hypothetical protein
MRFRLRTLLIVLTLAPPVLAGLYFATPWLMREERLMQLTVALLSLLSVLAGIAVPIALTAVCVVGLRESVRHGRNP